jgi:hypothetical protein
MHKHQIKKYAKQSIEKKLSKLSLKEELLLLREENKRLLRQHSIDNHQIAHILHLSKSSSKIHKIKASEKNKGGEAAACLILSDAHIEETVLSSTTNNLNEYNIDIAKNSLDAFFVNGVRLFDICKKDIQINNIILAILGDNITGYIHEDYLEANSLSPTQASLQILEMLRSGIAFIKKNTDAHITVVAKYGNHSRTTDKFRIVTAHQNNYEWMVYQILKEELLNDSRVTFVAEDGYLTYLDVLGYTIRFHHGNAIRFEGGVGGLTIPANKAIAQWDRERKANLDVFGHHHTLMLDGGKFVCNGSIIGYNNFGIFKKFAYEPPRQAFFLIDKERGKTICAPIEIR